MNAFVRWGKFNLVGAMGMVVQLAVLALFNRWMGGHYLYASAAAIEVTLLHNFVWHWHYTWRDRHDRATRVRPFVRFHLSSGLISMVGNLALMQLFVREAHLPLLVSNLIAILCCSIANFCVGDHWAFARVRKTGSPCTSKLAGQLSGDCFLLALLLPIIGVTVHAEIPTPPPASISSSIIALIPEALRLQAMLPSTYHSDRGAAYLYQAGAFCGAGMTLAPSPVFIEVGIMTPQANRSDLSRSMSLESNIPLA